MEELAVLIAFAIAIAMAIVMITRAWAVDATPDRWRLAQLSK